MKMRLMKALLCALAVSAMLIVGVAASDTDSQLTFTKDVAPIVFRNCAPCHRPGEAAPMSLLSYKEVRPWARAIAEVVAERRMPPWFADPHVGEFANDRRLSQKEIETITAWVNGGAREGNPRDLPPLPKFPEGWTIGKPDVVLSMPEEFSVPAEGVIPYKHYAVPTNFTEDKYVQMAEIKRGDPSVVHHVIVTVLEPGRGALPQAGEIRSDGQRGEPEGGEPQRERAASQRSNNPDGMLVGWAPGMSPLVLKPGQAKLIKKGSVLVFQMHYTTNGAPGKDRTSVGLVFARTPVEKRVITSGAFSRNLIIPPGEANYESTASFTFKEDSHIVSFMPHMHLRGKDFEYRLVYPDGTSKMLLRVPRYDFNWQLTYFVKEPIAAPKGSRLECLAHHDNSAKNKYNPDPTKEVRWGPQTWEEMMIGWFDYTLDGQNLREVTAAK
ncbi:MAG: thiol-disulfide isomerase [Acidobacteriota bacterium]